MRIKNCVSLIMAVSIVVSAMTLPVSAVKAYPGIQKITLEDGSVITGRLMGDEYCHALVTDSGFVVEEMPDGTRRLSGQKFDFRVIEETARRNRVSRKIAGATDFPTTGNLRGVVLLVEFADNEFHTAHTVSVFRDVMNEPGCSLFGATGSARDYFVDQSSGLFTPDFDVYGPIKLSKKMSYYGANNSMGEDSHAADMVKEACELAESDLSVDFSKYDYDNNGEIDFVYIIYAGYAESYGASSNTIWPHASNLASHWLTCNVGGKSVGRYACSGELKYISGTTLEGIGTFCHEFSHVLGLPDMYNTRSISDVQLGAWDVMDQGNYNNESHTPASFSAFERASLGWLELTELDTPSDHVALPELNGSNMAYRISTADENEFFTLENRQQVGWDSHQPGKGLMIIHVAYEKSAWDGNFVNSGIINRYDLVEADGTQGRNQENDLFPFGENDSFTDYSSPSSLAWDGTPMEKGVTQIRDEEGVITFRFMKDRLAQPVLEIPSEVGDDFFVARWQPVEDALAYRLNIREELSEDANPVIIDEDFASMTSGSYPNADMRGIDDSLDEYMSQCGWFGSTLYQAGGWLLVGYYGQSGTLSSPPVDLSSSDGMATVALRVKSYPGKSVNFLLSVTDVESGNEIASVKGKATKAEQDIVLPIEGATGSCRITFSTVNERVYVDAIRVLKGIVGDDEIWTAGPKEWSVDGIEDTQYRVEGLTKGVIYYYSVEATATGEMHGSLPSEEKSVTIGESSVGSLQSDIPVSISRFNLIGVPVTDDYRGIVIMTVAYKDGRRETFRIVQK